MDTILTVIAVLAAAGAEVAAIVWVAKWATRDVAKKISEQRKLEKQRNSINIVLLLCKDRDLSRALGVVAAIHRVGEDAGAFAFPNKGALDGEWIEKTRALNTLVGYFERISVGIDSDIYDWEIIYKCERGMFMTIHEWTKKFISAIRSRAEHSGEFPRDFGKYFEHVAGQFSNDNLQKYTPLQ